MTKTLALYGLFFLAGSTRGIVAQLLKPGFEKAEYIEMLKINQKAHIALGSWTESKDLPDPGEFNFIYRSPTVAFDNLWDLWIHKNKPIAVLAIQGSVPTAASFLANLYAAMVPANGKLQLEKDHTFNYHLSDNPDAAVHVGWLVAMAYLSKSIEHKIDSCYKAGIRDFILTGHSQGAGITFLLNSYLENLKREDKIQKDVRFKTYCSAGPKPGNLFYAHEYEYMTRNGWAYNVVNTADWVPDVPFSVQTVSDFTSVNPFRGAKAIIKKQKFPKNIALKHVYNKLSRPSKRAQRNYQKYLGKMISKTVSKQLPDLVTPAYYNSNYYVRAGNTIILYADKDYFDLYSDAPDNPNIWQHHLPKQYLNLAEKLTE
ncbi:MAG TPA: lipase family protein [Chryseolinea sp.]|nr:lipase family protein [Chryseolinea sp.]